MGVEDPTNAILGVDDDMADYEAVAAAKLKKSIATRTRGAKAAALAAIDID